MKIQKLDKKVESFLKGRRATDADKANILKVYNETNSIDKTSKLTKWSKNTVLKYVRPISSQKPASRNYEGEILQKDVNGNVTGRYKNAREAEKITEISQSSICQSITGRIDLAGGYKWERT